MRCVDEVDEVERAKGHNRDDKAIRGSERECGQIEDDAVLVEPTKREDVVRKRRYGANAWDVNNRAAITTNRVELLLRRNQLYATRGRTQSCRTVPVDSPLDSPASPL